MSLYTFDENSLIKQVTVIHSEGGGTRAYIFAREPIDPVQLKAIKQKLSANDMQWLATNEDGNHALEVRGFGNDENALLHLLKSSNAVSNGFNRKETIGDKLSFWEKIKKNTLKASGFSYFIGDAGFFVYGWKEAFNEAGKLVKPQSIVAGIFYALGTPFLAFFGRGDKSDFQLREISNNALGELSRMGITLPKDSALQAIAKGHDNSPWKRIVNFCQRYPAEITNSLFAVAGSMMIWVGIKDLRSLKVGGILGDKTAHDKGSIIMDIGLGGMTVLAGIISVFVEEEARDPNAPKKTGIARIWQYIKEKPLRAAGGALMASTICHTGSTIRDWRETNKKLADCAVQGQEREKLVKLRKTLPFRGVFVASAFTSEALMAISSKGHGAGVKSDSSLDRSVYAVMADLIHRSPMQNREKLFGVLSTLLANRRYLGGEVSKTMAGLREQVDALENNPWIGQKQLPSSSAKEESLKETPEKKIHWQTKSMRPEQPATSMAL